MNFRVLFRLALFKNCGYKILLDGGETINNERHLKTSTSQHRPNAFTKHGGHNASGYPGYLNGQDHWNLEGRALSALSRFGENARMISPPAWSYGVQHQHGMFNPSGAYIDPNFLEFCWECLLTINCAFTATTPERPTLSTILSEQGHRGALFVTGEVLFITRPLIYVLLIRKYGSRSWTPWFLSLAVDLLGTSFLSYATSASTSRKNQRSCLSDSEKDEVVFSSSSYIVTFLG